MSESGFGQVDQGLRIAGFTTVCLLFLLASVVFSLSSTIVWVGICGMALAILLPPAIPWISSRVATWDMFSPYIVFPIVYTIWFVGGSINFIDPPPGMEEGVFAPIPSWMYGMSALGLAGYYCGLFLGRKLPIHSQGPDHPEIDYAKMRRIVNLTFIGALIFWGLTGLQIGIPLLHPSTANATRLELHGPAYQGFMHLSFTVLILSPIFAWARGGTGRYDWFSIIAVPTVLSLLIITLGGRSSVVCPLLTLVIARSYFKKQSLWKLVTVGAVGFGFFSAAGYFREAASLELAPAEYLTEYEGVPAPIIPVLYTSLYLRYTVSALRNLTEIVPNQTPYRHGALTFLPITAFLPGHRDMSDVVFKNMFGHEFEGSGEPATILGPLYVDFGWPGIFIGMSMYGLLLSWTYRRMRSRPTAVRIITYAWWLQNALVGIYCNGFISVLIFILPVFWSILYSLASPKPCLRVTAISGDITA
jgi:oligosaccharide repeat unit polymerase